MLLLGHEIQKTSIHPFIPTENILREILVCFHAPWQLKLKKNICICLLSFCLTSTCSCPKFLNIFSTYNCCNSNLSYLGKKTFSLQPSYRFFVSNYQDVKQYSSIFLERRNTKGMEKQQFINTEIKRYIVDIFVFWPS